MRTFRRSCGTIALVGIVGLTVRAHPQGDAAPQPPIKPHTFDLASGYVRFPLPPDEQAYGRLDGDRMKQFVHEITAISRKDRDSGRRYWGRRPGTEADREVEQLIASKFREWGLQDVRLQPVDLPPQWFALDWELSARGSGITQTFSTIYPTRNTAATPPAGLDLDVVWVGLGTELDFAGRDVKGKLAFISSIPWPNGFQHTARFNGAVERAVEKGAAAVLINIAIPGNVTQSINAALKVPSFAIGSDDAGELKALLEKGPVRVRARLVTEQRPGLTDSTVWGTLPGATSEEIVIMAHHQGYFEGAFNNASGVATMLGLAEYFSKIPQANRRRTIKFLSTGDDLAVRLIHENRDTVLANAVLLINCERASVTNMNQFGPVADARWPEQGRLRMTTAASARQWWVHGSDRLASIALDAYAKFGVTLWDDEMISGGAMADIARDVPSVQTIVSPVYFATDRDTAEVVPAPGLESLARAYAKIIDQANLLSRDELR